MLLHPQKCSKLRDADAHAHVVEQVQTSEGREGGKCLDSSLCVRDGIVLMGQQKIDGHVVEQVQTGEGREGGKCLDSSLCVKNGIVLMGQ